MFCPHAPQQTVVLKRVNVTRTRALADSHFAGVTHVHVIDSNSGFPRIQNRRPGSGHVPSVVSDESQPAGQGRRRDEGVEAWERAGLGLNSSELDGDGVVHRNIRA